MSEELGSTGSSCDLYQINIKTTIKTTNKKIPQTDHKIIFLYCLPLESTDLVSLVKTGSISIFCLHIIL